ncbi:peptidoglycan-binding protein [Cellulomonas sp. B6]|uniref:peptidoglycan-binding domain-containing protein n=1 Tax=Cellulomonas sp. B6 TaxID=1295626 RepID=UPI00073C7C7A|nr:peptidoglycan-binding domain-containing protein [Cellulomonas sp. B6]KSW15314.1 hypothetical protein ATM99_02120 [Cellulomonas sp. B6]
MSRQRLLSSTFALVLAAGLGLVAAAPASAAYGPCNTYDPREGNIGVPYSSTNGTNSCYLVQGNQGAAVRYLQDSLKGCYGQAIAVDGIFGAGTRAALVAVQKRLGLTADGEYGPRTHNAMQFRGYSNGSGAPFCSTARFAA